MDPSSPSSPNSMPPLNPAPPPEQPPSYLDAINDKEKSGGKLFGIFSKKMLLIAGGVIALLVIVLVVVGIINNSQNAARSEITALGTKINELKVILQYRNENLISNNVTATVAAETDVIVASRIKELSEVYPSIDPESSLEEEQVPAIVTLNTAKAGGNLEKVYTETLRNQLLSICDQIKILEKSASDDQINALTTAYNDFQELINRIPVTDK